MVMMMACQTSPSEQSSESIDSASVEPLELAAVQYKGMMENVSPGEFPRSFENGELITSGSGWWCSGFYPGSLIYLFENTGDSVFWDEAMVVMDSLKKEQYNTATHDLGFMMYCPYGNANRLAPSAEYDEILLNSAKSLSTRFSPVTGCIRSWDSDPEDFLVIIDNMMNLELLFWATKHTGDSSFYDIAVTHANTTIENHFREDNSSWHVLNYNPETGEVQEKKTAQGLADDSAWARGQVWGLYGYTVTFRETGDSVYLEQAGKIAEFVLNHPNLPADKVPVWDFNAPADAPRDASAAAILASALLELDRYLPEKNYAATADEILNSLESGYMAEPGTNGNFIIEHCVGHLPAGSEVDVPLSYADYYFIESLMRQKCGLALAN